MNVTFPSDFLGSTTAVDTLALVVSDVQSAQQPSILIGTNTLDLAYEKAFSDQQPSFPAPHGYRTVLKILEQRYRLANSNHHGIVKLHTDGPQTIPAGKTVALEGLIFGRCLQAEKAVLVEHPTSSPLPGGLMVPSCVMDFPSHQPYHLPVVICNQSDHDVTLPAKAIIAEISAIQSIQCQERSHDRMPPNPVTSGFNFNFGNSPLTPEWKSRVTEKLNALHDVFAKHDLDFGKTDKVKHQIKLSDPTPFKQRPRPIHPQDLDAVRQHLKELVDSGVIRESDSPFASPIVVVRKKNGSVRLCIDYRKLNLQTIKDAHALPKLEDTFTALSGSEWFSVLDLKSGYYQIEMEEADKSKTAFVCPLGFYEFNRMPQGVTNAPSTFQRLMEKCMGEMNLKEVLVFIDDLIIFAPTLEEHERRLLKVLHRLKEFGLKLSVEKCMFFQKTVKYLGHVVSKDGVQTDPDKIETLKSWPVPKNLKELRSFLGFAGYYRRFIQGYSNIVKPLHDLTAGYPPSQRKLRATIKRDQYLDPKEPLASRWTPACQQAFDTIIKKLTTAPVLAFADPQKPYLLHTDASSAGLGAILYQEKQGQNQVIAYASHGLSRCESKYPAHKLEFLALKWAVTEKFHDYLYGTNFTVITDSNPLTYLLTSAKLDATSYRWLSALSTFSFKIMYRSGKQNLDADALSRRPHGDLANDQMSQKERERILRFAQHHLDQSTSISIDQHTVKAICDRQLVYSMAEKTSTTALIQSLTAHTDSLPDSFINDTQFASPVVSQLTTAEIAERQREDQTLRHVILLLETGESPPPILRDELPELPLLLRDQHRLELQNGILVRRRQVGDQLYYQLALPQKFRAEVLSELHDKMGHLGIERTLDLVRRRFYWPKMANDVWNKVKTCERCTKRKALPERAAPLVNIRTCRPLELVCMDFLSLEPDRSRTKDILVITDHFTKYAVTVPTPNQKAKTVAKCLWDNFLVHYGIPEKLHSDQGPDFESRTIKELCKMAGIHKIRTTPYHPRGNPVERFNRTLLNMLGTLTTEEKTHWKDFVKPLVHAYNCTRSDVTGYSPYELMFGRQPRLPIDLVFGLPVDNNQPTHSQYVQNLKSNLEKSYKIAIGNTEKLMGRNKSRFDQHITPSELDVGDRVLVRNVKLRGKHKIADKWEPDIYVVVKRADNIPVYTLRPENKPKPIRTLHRDLLLPCGFLPDSTETNRTTVKPTRKRSLNLSDEDCAQPQSEDEDDIISHLWYDPVSEPLQFTTIHSLPEPSSTIPATETLPPDMPFCEPATLPLPPLEPAESETPCSETPVKEEAPDPVESEDSLSSAEPTNDELPTEPSISSAADLPSSSDTSSSELEPVRTSTRTRKPPDRLQYSKLGQPILKSIQALVHGLTTAFTHVLEDEEDHLLTAIEQPVIRNQPPCTGTYMRSRGEPVTHVNYSLSNDSSQLI
ncbi:ubiquitin carboxyl-terminal hydrolase 12/46 [Sarotherodon galilaeus]